MSVLQEVTKAYDAGFADGAQQIRPEVLLERLDRARKIVHDAANAYAGDNFTKVYLLLNSLRGA